VPRSCSTGKIDVHMVTHEQGGARHGRECLPTTPCDVRLLRWWFPPRSRGDRYLLDPYLGTAARARFFIGVVIVALPAEGAWALSAAVGSLNYFLVEPPPPAPSRSPDSAITIGAVARGGRGRRTGRRGASSREARRAPELNVHLFSADRCRVAPGHAAGASARNLFTARGQPVEGRHGHRRVRAKDPCIDADSADTAIEVGTMVPGC
jgi:hypothetical protein